MSNSILKKLTIKMSDVMSACGLSSWIYNVETGTRSNLQGANLLPETTLSIDEYEGYIHPDDIGLFEGLLKEVKAGKVNEKHYIVRFSSPGDRKTFRYNELFAVPLNEKDGKITEIACVCKDVDNLIRYQHKLELADTKLKMALKARETIQYEVDVLKDMVYPIDDPYFPGMKEVPIEEYLRLFVPEGDQSEAVNKMRNGVDEIISTEYKIKERLGKGWRYYSFTHVPVKKDSKGFVTLYEGLRYDNTIRARMTMEMKDSNQLFRTVIDRLPCLFFMKDVEDDYRYVMANDQFCDSLGKPREEVEGFTDYDMMASIDEADAFRRDDVDAIQFGLKSVKEITMWKGVRRVWHTTKSKMVTETGKVYLLAMALEITSLEESMKELQAAKEKAEEADKLKSAFLANMSHEIRTPLNSILGFSDLLVTCEDAAEKEQFGKIINVNGELLLHLVNEVLDLSKIEAGYLSLKLSTFNLSKLINDTVAEYSEKMKKGVKLICSNPYNKFLVHLDRDRVQQVINNFVSNAIKYTVTGYIELGYKRAEGGVKIFVKDTGIGINEEDKPKVFGRFNKLDDFAQGTGLGLSICKTLALSAGGDAGFESTKDVGSTFWVFIPTDVTIDDGHTYLKDNEMSPLTPSPENTNKRILVVEDNVSNYELLEAILKHYPVDKATNGFEAVKMARENKYSIIFMDLMMPEMDGLEATKQIRLFDKTIPIIAITANIYAVDEGDARKAGCTAYVAKPVRKATIMKVLEEYLNK